jgi:hypothetical protein
VGRLRETIFDEWMAEGIKQGFCGPPVCAVHDGDPTTEAEDMELWDGGEPCYHVVRMYNSSEVKALVERNHPPSMWRNEWTPKLRLVDMPELNGTAE